MAKKEPKKSLYVVTYRDAKDGHIHSLKARSIQDSTLGLSFIAISEFVFETSSLVVNPHEEALALKFENVRTLHLSIYSVLSIEERTNSKDLSFKNDKSELKVIAANFRETT